MTSTAMDEYLTQLKAQTKDTQTPGKTGWALVDHERGEIVWASSSFSQWLDAEYPSKRDRFVQDVRLALEREAAAEGRSELAIGLKTPADFTTLEAFLLEIDDRPLVLVVAPHAAWPPVAGSGDSFDAITGLPDRRALDVRLESLAGRTPSAPPLAILFVDLNGFKPINDQHGHLVGDEVLATVARRLSAAIREVDFIARFGGDEFVILVEGIDSPQKLVPLVERLRQAAEQPIDVAGGSVVLSASIGMAHSSEGFDTPRDMLAAADERMYQEKRSSD